MIRPNIAPIIAAVVIVILLYTFLPFGPRTTTPSPPIYKPVPESQKPPFTELTGPSNPFASDLNPENHEVHDTPSALDPSSDEHETEPVDKLPASPTWDNNNNDGGPAPDSHAAQQLDGEHTIPRLIREADLRFSSLLASQSQTLEEATKAYRARRGRHPPPGFDLWFKYAQENEAVIVEEFWDQVYHDLEPFWAISPAVIRAQARALGMAVMIKDGHTDIHTDWFWHVIWKKMIDPIAFMLPDMVIPMNSMDEPRMMVPWADISEYISIADKHRAMPEVSSVRRKIQGWGEALEKNAPEIPFVEWHVVPPYSFAREACSPSAPIRGDYKLHNTGSVPLESGPSKNWMSSHRFVENSTLWSDTCQDPAIAAYHAALISPLSGSTSTILQPLFGGSKFHVNNDILLPAPMYWNGEERFDQEDMMNWSDKSDTVIWRGTATGGRHNTMNWPHFHRHRFVALANGTKHALAGEHDRIWTPAHRQGAIDPLSKQLQANLGPWLNKRNNIAFTDLFCDTPQPAWGTCWYLDEEYIIAPGLSLAQQYSNKYLPDIDGNSFSGRYRSFLQSKSLPIKATLYKEWHDSRLIAWKHFVPMNNRFTDYYSLLAYFVGCEEDICGKQGVIKGHDKDAEAIATAGSEWTKKVLRKVDMQIYMARVLLEYGRITDDHREMVGFVEDLSGRQAIAEDIGPGS